MVTRTLRILVLAPILLAGLALAQDARFAATFESVDGEPAAVGDLASGDVKVLRVEVRNEGNAVVEAGTYWVAFPPVDGATLFGYSGNGFSFPDRMLDAEGNGVLVDHGVHDVTQLHAPDGALAPGEVGSVELQVTVLSSRNTLAELLDRVHLVGADGQPFGSMVDTLAAPLGAVGPRRRSVPGTPTRGPARGP